MSPALRLIPVVDILSGQVVRAVGLHRRTDYRPLTSRIVASTDPLTVATAMLKASRASELYVADLDAIQGRIQPKAEWYARFEKLEVPVWLDGGFGTHCPLPDPKAFPFLHPVVGFETCSSPDGLKTALSYATPGRTAFSLDLRDGKLVGDWKAWGVGGECDSLGIAQKTFEMGCRRLIVLDLAFIGLGGGCGTLDLVRDLRSKYPCLDLIAGGGIRTSKDLELLDETGVNAVLVSSAIHDQTVLI